MVLAANRTRTVGRVEEEEKKKEGGAFCGQVSLFIPAETHNTLSYMIVQCESGRAKPGRRGC